MAFTITYPIKEIILIMLLSLTLGVSMANKQWYPKYGGRHPTHPSTPSNKIIVGGSEHWHFGFDYTHWALKNGPFYLNDTLVFKYDPPNVTPFAHSVYLLPNYWSFLKCDLKDAKLVADTTQGGGDGFEYVLKRWQPYYFACGERDGFHCSNGTMKFFVVPAFRGWY